MKLFKSALGSVAVLATTSALTFAQPVYPTATAPQPGTGMPASPVAKDVKVKPTVTSHTHHRKHRHHAAHKNMVPASAKVANSAPATKSPPAKDK